MHLSHKNQQTMERIYQHPVSHNLAWSDVIALVGHLGSVDEGENGHVTFTINEASHGFHRPHSKDIYDIQQVLDLRHFLESAGISTDGKHEGSDSATPLRAIVVVSQKETRVFKTDELSTHTERIHPYDPHHVLHHLNHTLGEDISSRLPENLAYYQAISESLRAAEEILLFGNGTGASSAMTHLTEFLTTHHPEVAKKIVGQQTVDIESLTEKQLLQEARTFFAD